MNDGLSFVPALAKLADRIFFKEHRDRKFRIRQPFPDEALNEFRGLGMHNEDRRRMIVGRIPANMSRRHHVDFMRIPYLLFADETVEDRDDILHPIVDKLMREARGF